MKYSRFLILPVLLFSLFLHAQPRIIPAAERISEYLPLIKGKKVGVFANQTSVVGSTHLVDTLRKLGATITVIFGPEHGFRGTADAGEKVGNYTDKQTGIPVVSLYGSKTKPSPEDLQQVDVLLFDIQDVGVRFYTYISSLEALMEAAIESDKPLLILDRPNPNGHYIDGPVLDKKYQSFVGRQSVPVVYGMTIGEYANMIAMEQWLKPGSNQKLQGMQDTIAVIDNSDTTGVPTKYAASYRWYNPEKFDRKEFSLKVITCENYTHRSAYELPVKPSPNLPNIQSIYLYPSTCFFEGTVLSEGRGTNKPFQVFGHPSLPKNLYSFTPNPNEGAKSSKLYGQLCYGWDLSGSVEKVKTEVNNKLQLKWLLEAYRLFPKKDSFFIIPKSGKMEECFFDKLAGNSELRLQIQKGLSEAAIRKSWEPGLTKFKAIREKYLLYEE
ncbi:DUF1343 domain-containing protein [Terrimonas sp. NA20]|uniref:DUF1343 domain-containing protein n=1 Tax=Terrimonas ginsenosidimutans TaxID=2908004 RepID=A0ABS9KY66_9BACT|nr:DUF1343 domain-containing protein [Terrimonas ginsenosidimutans]MCG2617258.1 DUF1343 domain-containing protein [Terrimonas ginsenosidimutans]